MENRINIALKGTSHLPAYDNGSSALMLNLRPDQGALKPVGKKLQLTTGSGESLQSLTADDYIKVFLHKNAEYQHWLGIDDNKALVWFDPAAGTATQTIITLSYTDINSVDIRGLKGFIIVITDTNLYRIVFDSATSLYTNIDLSGFTRLNFTVNEATSNEYESDDPPLGIYDGSFDDFAKKLLADIEKLSNEASKAGDIPGIMWARVGVALYDGSVIFPSEPLALTSAFHLSKIQYGSITPDKYYVHLTASNYALSFSQNDIDLLEPYKNLIQGVNIYLSNPIHGYDIAESTLDQAVIEAMVLNDYASFGEIYPIDDKINRLNDAQVWYKADSFTFEELEQEVDFNIPIDLKDYWTNYATKEIMRVDSGSWHNVRGLAQLVYNSRLKLGDINTELSDGYELKTVSSARFNSINTGTNPGDVVYRYTNEETYTIKQVTYIKTEEGDKVIVNTIDSFPALKQFSFDGSIYTELTNAHRLLPLPAQLAYPDARAYKMELAIKDTGSQYRKFAEISLIPSKYQNFSQYSHINYLQSKDIDSDNEKHFLWQDITADITAGVWDLPAYTAPTASNQLTDRNRVIASELNNPLYFPVDTSYRIGNGQIMALAVNTEALSQGQFGQYPVIVFTTEGIYAMMQGSYPVLFQAISPLNGESCISRFTLPISEAIIFFSTKGVTLLSGKQTIILSDVLNGEVINPIRDLSIYDECTDNNFLCNSQAVIDEVSEIREEFGGYLNNEDAVTLMGYDKKKNELIVFTPGLAYSWHYSLTHKTWFRCDQNYREVVNSWPESYVIDADDNILDLSAEDQETVVDVILQSNPIKMDGFYGINDLIFDCDITSGTIVDGEESIKTSVGIYLYGSERNDHYFLLGGTQTEKRVRDYKSNTFSRMKVSDIIFMLTAKVAPEDMFVIPVITLINKPKYNQLKS